MKRLLWGLLGIILFQPAQGSGLDIFLWEDTLGIDYTSNWGAADYGRTEVTTGFVYATDRQEKTDAMLLHMSLIIIDETGSGTPGLEAGIGPKLYMGTSEYATGPNTNKNQSLMALGLGGVLIYRLHSMNRIVFQGYGYHAPDITAMIDIRNLTEVGLRAGYELTPSAYAYLGYQYLNATFIVNNRNKSRDMANGIFLGVKLTF